MMPYNTTPPMTPKIYQRVMRSTEQRGIRKSHEVLTSAHVQSLCHEHPDTVLRIYLNDWLKRKAMTE